jgi:outer membrane protein assembly factor BamA
VTVFQDLVRVKYKIVVLFFLSALAVLSQVPDTTKLPFAIAKEKRIPDEELKNKKEGVYVTAAPELSSDPVNGFGYGVEGSLFFNGKRSDPFFAYTPYRARLDAVLFNTTRSQRELMLKLDVPYIFNSKWRLRVEGGYEANPNLLYFGVTERSLMGLSYYPGNDSSKNVVNDAPYSDYKNSQTGVNQFYNNYFKKEAVLNISMERSFLEGKLRVLLGYEAAYVNFSPFEGNSLLRNDYEAGNITGLQKGFVGLLQAGLIYDTRDLETDPAHGIFAELTNEISLKQLGSLYEFNKTFAHVNVYQKLLPGVFKRLILAARVALGYTALNSPFFEYQDEWSSEGSIEGLGGSNTLRGFKQSRFLSRTMTFNNVELRCRVAECNFLKQHFVFSGVPFFDAGAVWDDLSRIGHLENFRFSEGLGLRIAWNVNTILRFDYAVSKEDRQLFFNLAHAF